MSGRSLRTGEWLIEHGVCTPAEIDICVHAQRASRTHALGGDAHLPIGKIIELHGFADREQIEQAVRETGQVAGEFRVNLPVSVCREYQIMPLGIEGAELVVASLQPLTDPEKQNLLRIALGYGNNVSGIRIEPRDPAEIRNSLRQTVRVDSKTLAQEIDEFCRICRDHESMDDGGLLGQIITHLVLDALQSEASDIHVQQHSTSPLFNTIRYRIAGELRPRFWLSSDAATRLVTKLKDSAGCIMSDKLRPQDGRLTIALGGSDTRELRFACTPYDGGEVAILRLFDLSVDARLEDIFQFQPGIRDEIRQICQIRGKNGGMNLFTGPTGAGKSTTMTAALRLIPRHRVNVETLEDPVENRVPLVKHIQVNEAIGVTFAEGLRRMLRRDIDVIAVGELRDSDTAEIALRAAQTGHKLFSTLHTDTVPDSISRLVNMLDPGYRQLGLMAIASTLRSVVNQRLVRRLCSCAKVDTASVSARGNALFEHLLIHLDLDPDTRVGVPVGCDVCEQTGFTRRRIQVAEAAFFPPTQAVRDGMERLFYEGRPTRIIEIPGVRYYSREDAVRTLLSNRIIDLGEAVAALNLIGVVAVAA
jgi:type II secretory ATPase GspE/PulE/Tfp pilus assembly ATPase PilB-like protein